MAEIAFFFFYRFLRYKAVGDIKYRLDPYLYQLRRGTKLRLFLFTYVTVDTQKVKIGGKSCNVRFEGGKIWLSKEEYLRLGAL